MEKLEKPDKTDKQESQAIIKGLVTQADISFMQNKSLRDAYKATFSTPRGRLVLHHILQDLGFFAAVSGEGACERRNYGMVLIGRVTGMDGKVQSAIVDAIASFSPRPFEAINTEAASEHKTPMAGPDGEIEE